MKRFLRVFKVLTLVVMTAMLAGCATHLNLVERGYTPINSPNPEFVFVVEDKHFKDWIAVGASIEISSFREVSRAISTVFNDKAIAVYRSDSDKAVNIVGPNVIRITPVKFDLNKPFGYFFTGKFIADVSIGGNIERIEGRGRKGVGLFPAGNAEFTTLSDRTFLNFAKILREKQIKAEG